MGVGRALLCDRSYLPPKGQKIDSLDCVPGSDVAGSIFIGAKMVLDHWDVRRNCSRGYSSGDTRRARHSAKGTGLVCCSPGDCPYAVAVIGNCRSNSCLTSTGRFLRSHWRGQEKARAVETTTQRRSIFLRSRRVSETASKGSALPEGPRPGCQPDDGIRFDDGRRLIPCSRPTSNDTSSNVNELPGVSTPTKSTKTRRPNVDASSGSGLISKT